MTRADAHQRELQLLVALGKNAEEREAIEEQLRETRGYLRGWDAAEKAAEEKKAGPIKPPPGGSDEG